MTTPGWILKIARGRLLGRNLNDGMSWGIFPLFFAAFGLGVERIGILKAIYPAVWGILQTVTGPLSDRFGRKGLYVGASSGLVHDSGNAVVRLVAYRQRAAYPTLIAAVSDASHPSWRARSLSVYRFWRDLGYAIGALSADIIATCSAPAGRLPPSASSPWPLALWSPWRCASGRTPAHKTGGSMKALFILNDLPLRQRAVQQCATTRICCAELAWDARGRATTAPPSVLPHQPRLVLCHLIVDIVESMVRISSQQEFEGLGSS